MGRSTTADDGSAETRLEGRTICPGVAIGRVLVVDREPEVSRNKIDSSQVEAELTRYDDAREAAREQLREHIERVHGESWQDAEQVLRAHEAMMNDVGFQASVRSRISDDHLSAPRALEQEGKRVIAQFEATRSPYLQARAEDIRDLVESLVEILTGDASKKQSGDVSEPTTGSSVQVSGHLDPSQVIDARSRSSVAFVRGSQPTHCPGKSESRSQRCLAGSGSVESTEPGQLSHTCPRRDGSQDPHGGAEWDDPPADLRHSGARFAALDPDRRYGARRE